MINMKNEARVISVTLYDYKGVALCRSKEGQHVVWNVFLPKGQKVWWATNGHYFGDDLHRAHEDFALRCDALLPSVHCVECGELFSSPRSCATCIDFKIGA